MKRVIFIFTLLVVCTLVMNAQSDNLSKSIGTGIYTRDTLTASVDTAIVSTDQAGENYQRFVFQCYTTTGVDTVSIYTRSADNKFWIKQMLIDSAGTKVGSAIVGLVPLAWIINDSEIKRIMIISPSDDESTDVFIIAGKRY